MSNNDSTNFYSKREALLILKQLELAKNEKTVFWGASLFLKEFLKQHSIEGYNVVGIIDNNKYLWGEDVSGIKVYSPDDLVEINPKFIIFTIKNKAKILYKMISKQVEDLDIYETCLLPNVFKEKVKPIDPSNKIYLINQNGEKEEVKYIPGLEVYFEGKNGTVEIGSDPLPLFRNSTITCGTDCMVKIDSSNGAIRFFEMFVTATGCKLIIGKNFSIAGGYLALRDEPNLEIHIGEDCMFSASIYIRSSDGHAIYDNDTKQVINKPENLYIGNHVWLCNGATILKNTVISDNSIVAKNSVVTKKFYEKNIIIAGIPAKKVKGNINWDRKNTFSYEQELELSSRINNKAIIGDYDA